MQASCEETYDQYEDFSPESPQCVSVQVLHNNRDLQNLESESWEIVVQKQCLLHQKEGQVINSPSSRAHNTRQHQLLPRGYM